MENLELQTRVRSIVGRLFQISPAEMEGELRLGNPPQWDSIGHMQLLVAIEDEFEIRFPSYSIATLTSVEAIAKAVESNGGKQ